MPITYRIDRERSRIYTTCDGPVALPQVMAHFDALEKDPDCPARLDVLLDISNIANPPDGVQLRAAADRVGLVGNVVFGACAVVGERDAVFGMARMFEVFARGHFAAIRAFRQRREAEEWLDGF